MTLMQRVKIALHLAETYHLAPVVIVGLVEKAQDSKEVQKNPKKEKDNGEIATR